MNFIIKKTVVLTWCPYSIFSQYILHSPIYTHTSWSLPAILRFYRDTVILPQEGRKHCQEATGCNEWQGYLPQWNLNEGWSFLVCVLSNRGKTHTLHYKAIIISLNSRPQEMTNTTCCLTTNEIISGRKKVSQQITLTRNISFVKEIVLDETEACVFCIYVTRLMKLA